MCADEKMVVQLTEGIESFVLSIEAVTTANSLSSLHFLATGKERALFDSTRESSIHLHRFLSSRKILALCSLVQVLHDERSAFNGVVLTPEIQ